MRFASLAACLLALALDTLSTQMARPAPARLPVRAPWPFIPPQLSVRAPASKGAAPKALPAKAKAPTAKASRSKASSAKGAGSKGKGGPGKSSDKPKTGMASAGCSTCMSNCPSTCGFAPNAAMCESM